MKIKYTAKHTEITPEIETYCERRIRSLEKVLGYEVEMNLILSVEKYRHKAEVNVKVKGGTVHAVEETDDMQASLVAAFDNVDKRVKKEREKLRRKRRKVRELKPVSVPQEERPPRIIPSRDFSYKPMTVEEAVLQFSSEKREVYVFRKFDSEKWAVLYWRKDGNIGLIEPE
jgi:putative sigma-54 modulation protein